jgi:hypothetical protein
MKAVLDFRMVLIEEIESMQGLHKRSLGRKLTKEISNTTNFFMRQLIYYSP